MRFWQKIERARQISGIRFNPSKWYEPATLFVGKPDTEYAFALQNIGRAPACACFIGLAAWYDGRERWIPARMFELYPWLNEWVEFGAAGCEHPRMIPCYVAIEELSHLVAQHEVTWAEAYTLLELWEPKTLPVPRLEHGYFEPLRKV